MSGVKVTLHSEQFLRFVMNLRCKFIGPLITDLKTSFSFYVTSYSTLLSTVGTTEFLGFFACKFNLQICIFQGAWNDS